MDLHDLIIIGAGPAGLAAGIYAQERKLLTKILEAHTCGGQPATLYGDKDVYDYPSYPHVTGEELAQKLADHAKNQGAEIITNLLVESIDKIDGTFLIKNNQQAFQAKTVIVATGMGHFAPRKLGIKGESELVGKGIIYQQLPSEVMRKRIVIVGGGDTAVETAVAAAEKGAAVTLVHRDETFTALEKTVERAKILEIPFFMSSHVTGIEGLTSLEAVDIGQKNDAVSRISTDYLIICIGVEFKPGLFSKFNLPTEKQALIVNQDLQTTIPGLFACGDVIIPAGKYKRISIAVGTAATAINGVYQFLKKPVV